MTKTPMQALKRGVDGGADSAAGWKALAELQYQNRAWQVPAPFPTYVENNISQCSS